MTSSYVRNEALVKAIAQKDPSVLSDPAALARALGLSSGIERVRLTHGTPDETVRYYYALLGLAALMAAQSAAIAVTQLQPGEGGLGARLCASGTGRMHMLLGALLGSWAVSMLALSLAFAFMRLVARIDFGGETRCACWDLPPRRYWPRPSAPPSALLPCAAGQSPAPAW